LVQSLLVPLVKMNKVTLDLAKNMKGVRMNNFGRDIYGAQRAVRHLFRRPDRQAKYREYGRVGSEIKKAQKDRLAGRMVQFKARRARIEESLSGLGIDPKNFSLAARKGGMGRVGSAIYGRAAASEAGGVRPGIITRMGMNVLARGEGSIGKGIASYGAGMLEGGAGSLAEMAGRAAPFLAAIEGLKVLVDKNQVMNAEISDKLGKGGKRFVGVPCDGDVCRFLLA
jgi:hypothetical protein